MNSRFIIPFGELVTPLLTTRLWHVRSWLFMGFSLCRVSSSYTRTRSKTAPEDVLSLSYTWNSHKRETEYPSGGVFERTPYCANSCRNCPWQLWWCRNSCQAGGRALGGCCPMGKYGPWAQTQQDMRGQLCGRVRVRQMTEDMRCKREKQPLTVHIWSREMTVLDSWNSSPEREVKVPLSEDCE